MKLKALQQNFINSVLSKSEPAFENELDTSKISAEGLMGIYRNNMRGALSNALSLTYPVIVKLVGEEFFNFTAHKFIQKHYPMTGNLDDYGLEFSEFLGDFKQAEQLQYLPDMAKLEWLFHLSSLAANGGFFDHKKLSKIPQEDYFDLEFQLHPSVNFMESAYPIHLIYEMANSDSEDDMLDLSEEDGVKLMTIRRAKSVEITHLTSCEFTFLNSLARKESFYQAFEAACIIDEDFDLAFYIKKHIENETFCGFS